MLCCKNNNDGDGEPAPKLNHKNYLNVIFYILNTVITFGIGTLGWTGTPDNGELSEKYQTLVTPKGTAFSIWGIIFIFQAIFVVVQLLPRFRAKAMVQDGVGYWYIATCAFQAAWTFAFAYEIIWLALIFIILIWVTLVAIVYYQYYLPSEGTLSEFWLLRFPFMIHCGWLTAASTLNVNVQAVASNAAPEIQLAMGIISLAYLHAVSVWVVFGLTRPNYTIALVISWASGWIYSELQDPKESIQSLLDPTTILGVSYAAGAVAFIVAGQVVVRVLVVGVNKYLLQYKNTNKSDKEASFSKGETDEEAH
eukprot:CAMPEP_0194029358 /NCGR_PEP_ID=MMETSP0009_2-20130614/3096_1 /TAXON_ID=210454 /ORGANISM="Grammatophora oceanica, Strain CCMP 410" /LENGTH=308 /DNA_ID=CAMNT_0038668989 /DNA_START=33 /DNA_END=959 /DNA_ORIENTATION=+